MKTQLSYLKKLSVLGTKSLVKYYLLAIVSTLLYLVVGSLQFKASHEAFFSTVSPAQAAARFIWLIGLILLPVLLFIFSNKYVFSKIASLVVEERQDDLILPAFDKAMLVFQSNQPDVIQNVADYSFAKLKLINDVKNTKIENPWVKRIVVFGLNKVKFDALDLDKNDSFYAILRSKFMQVLEILTEPSSKSFWLCIFVQWLILLVVWFSY
ncbi:MULTISPECIES: hypothetical protein [unclassified Sphingobacterium]|uniref:hypothetical protein n=1 Tax=unclassified Sphingobacterium TaxID=2609468 RepID=UPI002953431E|nr:hypothetical protein [Sphingobacterium sp. UGAL515B_05]WON94221.1 hypothetical protein OK025_23615 [Sphingobacterium sp. UGAL515B_05]